MKNEQKKEVNLFEEFDSIKLDKRLKDRLAQTANTLYKKPSMSILAASRDRFEAKAIYRLIANEKFKVKTVIEAHRESVIQNIKEKGIKVVLCPQDTTSLNYTGLKNTKGIGPIANSSNSAKGLLLHTSVALTENGTPLGILSQKVWARTSFKSSTSSEKRNMPIEEKESYKWIESANKIRKCAPKDVKFITLCDREGDMYELFSRCNEAKQEFLVRAVSDRKTNGPQKSFGTVKNAKLAGKLEVHVPRNTRKNVSERNATLSVKYKRIQLKKPDYLKGYSDTIAVTLVLAEEKNPPDGVEPILWYLLTNVSVNSFADAVKMVNWYVQRWKIERFHFVLKSGCKIEERQSSDVNRLKKLIILLSLIAIKILTITYFARNYPETSCEEFFTADEWKVLYCIVNDTKVIPKKPPTIKEAVFLLAKYGGFAGRKCDGDPGAKVIWRGMFAFNITMKTVDFFQDANWLRVSLL